MIKDRPRRLGLIYFRSPLFFVTFCTRNHAKIPSLGLAQQAIENYGRLGLINFGVAIGRYVIMPITCISLCAVITVLFFLNGLPD